MKNLLTLFLATAFLFQSCGNGTEKKTTETPQKTTTEAVGKDSVQSNIQDVKQAEQDTITLSKIHKPNSISCDLDGDNLSDTVEIVQNTKNKKYGLKITFGNGKVEYLGMGVPTLVGDEELDDIEWVGVFEVAAKGEVYYNNVGEDGTILSEEEIKEEDKIRLINDGIFIHQAEACGGGIIYLKDGKYEWIQQE